MVVWSTSSYLEMELKDDDSVTMLPLIDGRIAYMDKSGAVFMCGLKEESLTGQLENSYMHGVLTSSPDAENIDPEFSFSNMFPEQCSSLVLKTDIDDTVCEETDNDQALGQKPSEYAEEVDDNAGIIEEESEEVIDPYQDKIRSTAQVEDDCVEQVTIFKCRACTFTAPVKDLIVQHYMHEHLQQSSPETAPSSFNKLPVNEEFERLARSVTADSEESEGERLLFLCVKCQGAFDSIELCREHMIQEHKFVSGKSKTNLQSPGNEASALPEINTSTPPSTSPNLLPSAISGVMPIADVGGIKVEWQPANSSEAVSVIENGLAVTQENGSNTSVLEKEKVFDKTSKLEIQKVRERERKIKCTFRSCVYKFSNQKSLQIHLSCHSKNSSNKEFHCVHCDEKFVRWRLCSAHLWRVHQVDVDLLPCPVCLTYKAATPMKLEIHMRTHGDHRPFRCKLCPKSYKQSAQLRNHCTSVHFDKKAGDAAPRWYMEQRCNICGKTYADAKCLKKHVQAVHSKMKPYVCTVCGHSSACRAMLALHLRQHTGEKPHACTHCPYRTGDHNTLRRHMMRHTGQRQYKCPYCPYEAIQSNSYKAHVRTRHPGETGVFSCSLCSFQTVSQDTYVQHVADHQKGLIASREPSQEETGEEVEYFPGNMAAAHLVYRYLGTLLHEPGRRLPPANITDSRTSADGTTQSITIRIPSQDDSSAGVGEDEESSHSFLMKGTDDDVGIDTGGITIPAEPPSDLALIES